MNRRLNDVHLRRGRLLERIATQRADLVQQTQPLRAALYTADRAVAHVQAGIDYVKRHPSIAAVAVAALFFMRAGRVWRWTKRGFLAWQTLRMFGDKLAGLGWRWRS